MKEVLILTSLFQLRGVWNATNIVWKIIYFYSIINNESSKNYQKKIWLKFISFLDKTVPYKTYIFYKNCKCSNKWIILNWTGCTGKPKKFQEHIVFIICFKFPIFGSSKYFHY